MDTGFTRYGALHWAILIGTVAGPYLLARGVPERPVRIAAGVLLAVNEIGWYAYRYLVEHYDWLRGLPLQLCDASVWLTAAAAVFASKRAFELGYYWGIAGASMALIMPDLWAPCWSYPTLYFWSAHVGIVAILLHMIFTGVARPGEGSVRRAFVALLGFAAFAGVFNAAFGTNYMYLREKPAAGSLLDAFGPWPWYIGVGVLVGLAMFLLLYLPFWWKDRKRG